MFLQRFSRKEHSEYLDSSNEESERSKRSSNLHAAALYIRYTKGFLSTSLRCQPAHGTDLFINIICERLSADQAEALTVSFGQLKSFLVALTSLNQYFQC